MVSIAHCQDIEVLRQIALLQEQELRTMQERIQALTRRLAQLEGKDATAAQVELEFLKELLAQRTQALFGDSSEKRPRTPPSGEPKPPRRGHGPRAQLSLPVIEVVHDLPEGERTCPECGGVLSEMAGQFEESEEITVVEREFKLVKHQRRKYRCRCNACVVTAPGPLKLQPGGRYSVEFAVEVAVAKYLDHLPLERQRRMMAREGLTIDSQTLWDQIDVLGSHLELTYEALRHRLLAKDLVHADETWWRLMGKDTTRWWVWTLASEDTIVHRVLPSRSQEAARAVLEGYTGTVMADGYGVYTALARAGPTFTLVHCWAHVRRKVLEAEAHYPEEARQALEWIGKLYGVEREAGADAALRHALRRDRSQRILDELKGWAHEQRALPQSSLGKAIHYMLELWPGLTVFVNDPRIPLDNNAAERGLRGVVLGRKNHYGSRSERGTQVAALFYSLLETAKLCVVDPKDYLLRAARQAIADPETVVLPIPATN